VAGTRELLPLLPGVDDCLQWTCHQSGLSALPRSFVKNRVRRFVDQLRRAILDGRISNGRELEPESVRRKLAAYLLDQFRPRLRRVINATGVIVHTNLGRSILPPEVMEVLQTTGSRYSNLEFDLDTGRRGSRYSLVEELLCELTGAEAGLVVNNNAAAVLITLETLARQKEVIVSRGQLVEIGGSFRIPDIMRRSGATLVEVGATNRTHLRDYQQAIGERTGLLLRVHCSNYRIIGFTSEVGNSELVRLGHEHGLPVMEDLGSGCLVDLSPYGLEKEPTVQEVVASGMDVITFSGDKLLGGPQAGLIVGRRTIIDRIRANPLNRALRIDKFTLAGLEAVLRLYRDPAQAMERIPTLAMIATPEKVVAGRARRLLRRLRRDLGDKAAFSLVKTVSRVGGGAMPEQNLSSHGVLIRPLHMGINRLEERLRQQDVALVGRIEENQLLLDCRTLADDEIPLCHGILKSVLA